MGRVKMTRQPGLRRWSVMVALLGLAGVALLGWSYVQVERGLASRWARGPSRGRDEAAAARRDTQLLRARALLDAGDYPAAVAALDRALAVAPGDAEILALQVRALRAQRHYTAARSTARRILDSFPESPLAHILLGSIALQEGDTATARRDLQHAVELDTSSSLALAQLATLELMEGKVAEARRVAQQALALNPQDATSLRVLTRISRSVPELLALYSRLREIIPDDLLTRSWIELLRGSAAPEVNYVSPIDGPVTVFCETGTDGRMYVRARIGPFGGVRLLLDTGASGLTLSETLARRMGLRLREFSESSGVGGQTRHSHPVLVDRIDVGGMRARALMATASDLPAGTDGILNPLIFAPPGAGVSVEIRPQRGTLTFLRAEAARQTPRDGGWVTVPYLADSHHVIFPIVLGGRPATALLDTGAGVDMIDHSVLERLPGATLQQAAGQGEYLVGFGGRVSNAGIVERVAIRLAGQDRTIERLYVVNLNSEEFRFQVDLDAIVGAPSLAAFDLRIDPGAGILSWRATG